MGSKCTDRVDRGPEPDIRWRSDRGSTSWQRTDADGLTADDRAEQAGMTGEAIAEARADRAPLPCDLDAHRPSHPTRIRRPAMNAPCPVSPADIAFRRLGPDLCDILLRDRHIGTLQRIPDLASAGRRYIFRVTVLFDPEGPRNYTTIETPRRTIAHLLNGLRSISGPPPVHLQRYICEHRRGLDEFRSELIRRDRFLDSDKADAYFELVEARLRPGEFAVLRLGGKNLRLSHAGAAAA